MSRTTRIDPGAAAGFGAGAAVYERARPSYPADAVDWIVERARLARGRTLVDLAAGTGKLTRLLAASGVHLVAVEPVPEMREQLALAVPGVEVVDATAEDLPFADQSVDVVTVAQAFHWFDLERTLPELHRVLRPDGLLVLVWNMRDLSDPLQRQVEDLLLPIRRTPRGRAEGGWREPLARSPLFAEPETRTFPHVQRLTAQDLVDRVHSTSFVAAMPADERGELLNRVRLLVRDRDEPFPFPYVAQVQVMARRS